jgi:hypothetical protein
LILFNVTKRSLTGTASILFILTGFGKYLDGTRESY